MLGERGDELRPPGRVGVEVDDARVLGEELVRRRVPEELGEGGAHELERPVDTGADDRRRGPLDERPVAPLELEAGVLGFDPVGDVEGVGEEGGGTVLVGLPAHDRLEPAEALVPGVEAVRLLPDVGESREVGAEME